MFTEPDFWSEARCFSLMCLWSLRRLSKLAKQRRKRRGHRYFLVRAMPILVLASKSGKIDFEIYWEVRLFGDSESESAYWMLFLNWMIRTIFQPYRWVLYTSSDLNYRSFEPNTSSKALSSQSSDRERNDLEVFLEVFLSIIGIMDVSCGGGYERVKMEAITDIPSLQWLNSAIFWDTYIINDWNYLCQTRTLIMLIDPDNNMSHVSIGI